MHPRGALVISMFYAACVFISVILCFEFHSTYSGWLSGKLKRGVDKPEADTRIEWTSAAEGRAHHSHPDFKWFSDNEQAWAIIDKCKHIADKKGVLGLLRTCLSLLTSPKNWHDIIKYSISMAGHNLCLLFLL